MLFSTGRWGCPFFLLWSSPQTPQSNRTSRAPSSQELASDTGFLTTVLCALGGFSLLLGLASREHRLQRWTRPLSGLVWAALLALGYSFLFTGGVVSAWDQVRGAAGGERGRGKLGPRTRTQATRSELPSSLRLQLPMPLSPRYPFSSLSSSRSMPCCPWACGTPPPRASPPHSHTCWFLGCILGLNPTLGPRCCLR